jgi:hypothetical protein
MQGTIHKCGDKLLIDLPIELSLKLGWSVGDILSIDQLESGLKINRANDRARLCYEDRARMHG